MITLFIGGASSGKSRLAEQRALRLGVPVTYVATWRAATGASDPDMETRIARHQARRPGSWLLREVDAGESLGRVLREVSGPVLVDSLGTWVAGAPGFTVDCADLCRALAERTGETILVSDEVGMGVHPSSEAGRRFREAIGPLNEAVAAVADEVWLVVAGRLLALGPSPWAT